MGTDALDADDANRLRSRVADLEALLGSAHSALACTPQDALGHAEQETDAGITRWPIRDELLHKIERALENI